MTSDRSSISNEVPPNDIIKWDNDAGEMSGMEIVANFGGTPQNMRTEIGSHVLAFTKSLQAVNNYVTEHGRGEIELPQYYSRFKEEFGQDEEESDEEESIYIGPEKATYNNDGVEKTAVLRRAHVETALRVLNGKGRYSRDDYTLHDCLPMPCVLEGEEAAILIAPGILSPNNDEE